MKIGLYIEDQGFTDKDLSNPIDGNPGIGGTWYEFVLLAYFLCKDKHVYIYHHRTNKYPEKCTDRVINSYENLFLECLNDKIDLLIYKTNKNEEWYRYIEKYKVNCIAWSHTFLSYPERKIIENSLYVKRMVCVGKEHYDLYIDEDIIKKTSYIYNMVCRNNCISRSNDFGKNVTYIGSIIPAKSFHVLAKVWKDVIAQVPDAQLHVIGAGNLYQEGTKLGKYGIAEENYEKSFISYLTDSNGMVLPSVHFHGKMGNEKNDLICNTSVGVVNPTTKSETFCISAVEFEECGVPVCAGRKNGLLDTVSHNKTGLLSLTRKALSKNIVFLLKNRAANITMGNNAANYVKRFDPSLLINNWNILLQNSLTDEDIVYIKPNGNYFYNCKWLRIANRFLRFNCKLSFLPSIGCVCYDCKYWAKRIINR